jgi:hypothetical protein
MTIFLLALLVVSGRAAAGGAQEPQHTMPPGMTHDEHLRQLQKDADLKTRGAAAMGFDQETTVHHFVLKPDGGAIEVSVRSSSDRAGRDAIRAHLQQIAKAFAAGDFATPLATHGELPPGADAMKERRSAIVYSYEKTPDGGRVRIATKDPSARAAVHEFLRYQIREHATGDSESARR